MSIRIAILSLCLLAGVRTVLGQYITNPDSALQTILNQMVGTRLSLSDAGKDALTNATSVQTAEAAYMSALGVERREAGTFDPSAFFTLNYIDDASPTASFFSGAPVLNTLTTSGTAGLQVKLPVGTSVRASLSTVRLATNSSFASLSPQYTAVGALSFRQPLLTGFHISARKDLVKAERDADAAKARYDQEALAVSSKVEQSYWDLYAAERDYGVQKLIRDQAQAFLKDAQLRSAAGLIGPSQVATARTFLAEQEILLLDREEQLDRLSDQLGSLIGVRPDTSTRRFIASDSPPSEFPEGDVDKLVRQSFEGSLSLRAARADVEASRALSDAASWEALPSVNLVGSLGGNGLGGDGQVVSLGSIVIPAPPSRSYSDAVNDAVNRNFRSWSVGVEVNVPIGLRNGLGERDRLDARRMISEQQYIQQQRDLEERVRGSFRELSHGKRRLGAARDGVTAAQEQVRIGTIEFQNGRTTAFELVRLGADLAAAQQRYSQALVRSAKAAAELRQLTSGTYPGEQTR